MPAGLFVSLLSYLAPFLSSTVGLRADYFSYDRDVDLSPRASLTLKLDEKSSVSASAGVYYQTLKLERGVLDASKINGERRPSYHCLNVRFDERFNFSGCDIVCYLSVWNVYNRKNVAQYFWSQVKNVQETIYQWGILPVFGIEYEF